MPKPSCQRPMNGRCKPRERQFRLSPFQASILDQCRTSDLGGFEIARLDQFVDARAAEVGDPHCGCHADRQRIRALVRRCDRSSRISASGVAGASEAAIRLKERRQHGRHEPGDRLFYAVILGVDRRIGLKRGLEIRRDRDCQPDWCPVGTFPNLRSAMSTCLSTPRRKDQIPCHENPDRRTGTDRNRRLDVEIALGDLLPIVL